MNHKGTKRIETQRMILRPFTIEDVDAAFENWMSDEEVTRYLTWPPHENKEVTHAVLSSWIASYNQSNFYQWAMELKESHELIGNISVVHVKEEINTVSIGYCIGKAFWKKGYTSEAFRAIIPFLFEEVEVNRIEATHDANNPNSGLVMKKCGLQYEGTLRHAALNNQGIVDVCIYSLLKEEWESKNDKT